MTNYKEMMNGKREIPISSCPSYVEDLVYGTGPILHSSSEEENTIPEIIPSNDVPAKKGKKTVLSERTEKLNAIRKDCGYDAHFSYVTVYTDNTFVYDGAKYQISDSVEDYAPKVTTLGTLYDMDKIVCVKCKDGRVHFYTAKYDAVPESEIKNIS